MDGYRKIIVALDVPTLAAANSLANDLSGHVGAFKIGLELLTSEGAPQVVRSLSSNGSIFFDGKFKDIPNTVEAASRAATRLGVWMFNVHALGGAAMMSAARTAAEEEAKKIKKQRPLIIGVTILTSMDAKTLNEIGFENIYDAAALKKLVVHLSLLAKQSGLDGVVASPQEIKDIRAACGSDFLIVTPGVRPTWAATGDQKRVMTPREAVSAGADYLVIGRPITDPPPGIGSPADAAKMIAEEIRHERSDQNI